MIWLEYFLHVFSLLPFFSAISCLLLLSLVRRKIKDLKLIYLPLYCYFFCVSIVWITISMYYNELNIFWFIRHFTYLAALLVPIFFYHYTYNLTLSGNRKRFSWIHYLLPILIFLSTWFRDVSFEEITFARFIINLPYGIMCIVRVGKYKQTLTREVFYDKTYSLSWINTLIIISFLMIAVAVGSNMINFENKTFQVYLFLILSAMTITFQLFFLLVYSYRLNLEFLEEIKKIAKIDEEEEEDEEISAHENISTEYLIKKDIFEAYICSHKPYLDSLLTLTDLAERLKTNRTYLSAFINRTYGIGFVAYINRLRMQEYEHLSSLPENKKYNLRELVFRAGFTNYQQYLRYRKQNEKRGESSDNHK